MSDIALEAFLRDSEDAMTSRFYTYPKMQACKIVTDLSLEDISQKDLNRIHRILSYIKAQSFGKAVKRFFKGLDELIAKVDAKLVT